jgi:hypothetical protein
MPPSMIYLVEINVEIPEYAAIAVGPAPFHTRLASFSSAATICWTNPSQSPDAG